MTSYGERVGRLDLGPWRRRLLLAILTLLLIVSWQGPATALGKALFIVQFGLFILWQPFVASGHRLGPVALAGLAVAATLLAIFLDARLFLLWCLLLAALVGGKVPLSGARAERAHYLGSLAFLLLLLLTLSVPAALAVRMSGNLVVPVYLGLLLILMLLVAIPGEPEVVSGTEVVDFINSLLLLLLLAVVVLGSLADMLLFGRDYATALFDSLMVLGSLLLVLAWLWNPRGGGVSIGDFFSRYVMSLGVPTGEWLRALADRSATNDNPDRFVEAVTGDMAGRLGWVSGLRWSTPSDAGSVGLPEGRESRFGHLGVNVVLYTVRGLSPALVWHVQLLVQLLGEFHADKVRAQRLKELSYMQAVHETGARLTHDVKNLLQSLQTLCYAIEDADSDDSPALRGLLHRQLPALAGRLGATLEKLRAANDSGSADRVPVRDWWAQVERRYAALEWVALRADVPEGQALPAELFTAALENLMGNIEEKRAAEPGLHATVRLSAASEGVLLRVCDDGSPVPDDIAVRLFQGPVPSAAGLGIGLYQVAALAGRNGYGLALAENVPERVCFELHPAAAGKPAGG